MVPIFFDPITKTENAAVRFIGSSNIGRAKNCARDFHRELYIKIHEYNNKDEVALQVSEEIFGRDVQDRVYESMNLL